VAPNTIKIFLASSSELKKDREQFEIFINRKNKDWVKKGSFLELVVWEDFLDFMAQTRLQDEYNQAILGCDLFVMLFCTKVGKYTAEEFETAFGQFKESNRPLILTYFYDEPTAGGNADRQDLTSLWDFQDKLKALGHFQTEYKNTEGLKLHFNAQLDKLASEGRIGFNPKPEQQPKGETAGRPQPNADAPELRRAYLAWLSARANELPLLAGDGDKPVQLSSVYTALLTQSPDLNGDPEISQRLRGAGREETRHLSALEALDRERLLVLMGGPGSGKTTFLNFVALCLAGESLGTAQNLKLLRTPVPPDPGKDKNPKPQSWNHGALLPVKVVLRDFAAVLPAPGCPITADTLWDFIVKQLPEQIRRFSADLQAELMGKGGLILLDGLDEVPDALQRREQVKQAVQAFVSLHPRCRFLVTSRTYAYQRQDWKLDGFAERELLPFSRGQIERFIDTWYAHMAQLVRLTEEDATGRGEVLKRAIRRPELAELATRPLLLTLMARLQTKGGGTLPENRETLYAQSVDMLLDEWEGLKLRRDASGQPVIAEPSLTEWLGASREAIRRELDRLAYEAHLRQPELVGTADIRQAELIAALMAASRDKADTKLLRLEEYLRDRAGLLTSHGEGLYQFPHRSFQEYLAACHLARFQFPDALSSLVKSDPNRWREVTLLAAAGLKNAPSAIWDFVEELCAKDEAPTRDEPEANEESQWGALLAGEVLDETGLAAPDPNLQARHEKKRCRVRDWQLCLLRSTALPARERALAGDLLARLGDPRADLLDVDHLRFALVAAGPFWMGEEGDNDAPLHRNEGLDYGYWIAQTPITVAQFRQFVEASEYPGISAETIRAFDNLAVVWVSWNDAESFCSWLSRRWQNVLPNGWIVRIPSEAEWEKAARGGESIPVRVQVASAKSGFVWRAPDFEENVLPKRDFPWGDDEFANCANWEALVGMPTSPGCFVGGCSPYGCEDLVGNVAEWTRSVWNRTGSLEPEFVYSYDPRDPARDGTQAGDKAWRIVRGGSWGDSYIDARCASRGGAFPWFGYTTVGFRVVLKTSGDS
jgi:formylglycine-generating enzyme required for sulfatase activity